jgi:hypothetical protein
MSMKPYPIKHVPGCLPLHSSKLNLLLIRSSVPVDQRSLHPWDGRQGESDSFLFESIC